MPREMEAIMDARQQEFERQVRVAWSYLKDVEKKTEEMREARDAQDRATKGGTVSETLAAGAPWGRLAGEYQQGLDLAWKFAAKASEIQAEGSVEIDDMYITPRAVFSAVCALRGALHFEHGRWDQAIGCFKDAIKYADNPAWHCQLGIAYINRRDPAAAVQAFERGIELDPTGEYGIEATKNLERLKAGTLGKKVFTGSWKVVAVLGGLTLISLFILVEPRGADRGTAIFSLLLWGGMLAAYWWLKYK